MLVDVADDAVDGGGRCRCGILHPLVGGTLHFKKQRREMQEDLHTHMRRRAHQTAVGVVGKIRRQKGVILPVFPQKKRAQQNVAGVKRQKLLPKMQCHAVIGAGRVDLRIV